MNDLTLIENAGILSSASLQSLCAIKNDLRHNFEVNQIFRSHYEQRSILNDVNFPTPDAKHWQAVREQQVHLSELIMLSFEYRKTLAKIELSKERLAKETSRAREELLRIEIEQLQFVSIQQQRVAQDRVREVLGWHKITEELKPQLEYGPDSYEEHQPKSYFLKQRNKMAILDQFGSKSQDISSVLNIVAGYDSAQKGIEDVAKE